MSDEVVYTGADRATYRVRGLRTKARSISLASQELDRMIAERLAAGRRALERWRGPHAVTYRDDLNAVLGRMVALKATLWQAATTLSNFPQPGSWNAVRYGEELTASAQVDVPIEPGTVRAVTDDLRAYVTTASGQDERLGTLAATVNLDGVSAEVSREIRDGTAVHTEPVDVGTLVTLPAPNGQVSALRSTSSELNSFTSAVATAIDRADQGTLALLAQDPAVLWAKIAWLREDRNRDGRPDDAARRWASLPPALRQVLIAAMPWQIGTLDGIPTIDRHRANTIVLDRTRAQLRAERQRLRSLLGQPPPGGFNDNPRRQTAYYGRIRGEIERITKRLGGIRAIEQRLRRSGGPPAYLLGLSGDGSGRAIVAIGNPDTADNVATLVPGAANTLSKGSIGQSMRRAEAMYGDAAGRAPGSANSAIVWLGYESPAWDGVWDTDRAARGAQALRDFQDGLARSHVTGLANRTVIGHSYGATVVGHAARQPGFDADNVVFVGSFGVGAERASDLSVGADHVFATSDPEDTIDDLASLRGTHGTDPTAPDFGVRVFPSDSGFDGAEAAHSAYWEGGNPARRNLAAIITGRYDEVERMPPPPPPPPPPPGDPLFPPAFPILPPPA